MSDINHVVLIGRLTRDAEVKYIPSGQGVCEFSLAINRPKKNGDRWEEEANFFDITYWLRNGGEGVTKYLLKGKTIGVEGSLRQRRWEQDGQKRSKVDIMASNIQLLGGNPQSEGGYGGGGSYGGGGGGGSYAPRPAQAGGGGHGAPAYGGRGDGGGRGESPAGAPPGDDGFSDDIPF